MRVVKIGFLIPALLVNLFFSCIQEKELHSGRVSLRWSNSPQGWRIEKIRMETETQGQIFPGEPSGLVTILYSEELPEATGDTLIYNNQGIKFPEEEFTYIQSSWKQVLSPVRMNQAGVAFSFLPQEMVTEEGTLVFTHQLDIGKYEARWRVDSLSEGTFFVKMTFEASMPGYFSIASPDLFYTNEDELKWATVPGHFQGREIREDLPSTLVYGQGLPALPYIAQENTVTTLTSIMSNNQGISYSVTALPAYGRDPWEHDGSTHTDVKLGFSHMNRMGQLTPTTYYPLLDHDMAKLEPGQKLTFECKYSLIEGDWYTLLKQTALQDFDIANFLSLKESSLSLTHRIFDLLDYSLDDQTSRWNEMESQGIRLGAQSYLGGVEGSDGDATKNSDIGAMWMMAKITDRAELQTKRLPLIRNFKIQQIEGVGSGISGAIKGQYYLTNTDRWVEEWGNHTEPIAITYYNMLDLGNILLFEPEDGVLREYLRLGAERLLEWQKPDGSWAAGYLKDGKTEVYIDLMDYRPTFYGLLVAYNMLGDERYLRGAIKGAEWLVTEGVQNGFFTGVCGDTRFVNDFSTSQVAQALLDLWEVTGDVRYKDAAIFTAKIYTTSIYTHPIPNRSIKLVNGKEVSDWAISQVGLGFEHGGNLGSATGRGPILLASHAGLFIRIAQITGDEYFATLARSAIWGRDAFLNPENKVASYYWLSMDAGAGKFPHHAWWQIGLLTDYLLSEISYRSQGAIDFPAGFFTPKVGPHKTFGFKDGKVFGKSASLMMRKNIIVSGNSNLDYLAAWDKHEKNLYVFLLNNSAISMEEQISLKLPHDMGIADLANVKLYKENGELETLINSRGYQSLVLLPFSMRVLEIPVK